MATKRYPLAEPFQGLADFGELIETADMHRGDMRLLTLRVLLDMAQGLLTFSSLGFVLWYLLAPASRHGWWSAPVAAVGGVYLGWLAVRFWIGLYVRAMSNDPRYEWRPGGCLMTWHGKAETVYRGEVELPCPHCPRGRHEFEIHLHRREARRVGYVPTFFDPLFATRIEYNRWLKVPLRCPDTGRSFAADLPVRQSSYDPVVKAEMG